MTVKLNMSGLEKLAAQAAASHGEKGVAVGVQANSGQSSAKKLTLVDLAVIHEFGSEKLGIPERSFIRAPLTDSAVLKVLMTKLGKGILLGRFSFDTALELLGTKAAAHLKNYTKKGSSPHKALSKVTIKRKGSSRPLVDTGQLINSISYKVIK